MMSIQIYINFRKTTGIIYTQLKLQTKVKNSGSGNMFFTSNISLEEIHRV